MFRCRASHTCRLGISMPLPAFTAAITKVTNLEWSEKPDGGVSIYKNGIYCGPGWGYTYKDILDGKIKEMPKAIDAIDEACRLHDPCYEENGYFAQGSNMVLSANLVDVIVAADSPPKQRAAAT